MFRDPTRTPRSAGEFERAKLEAGRRMGPPRAAEKGACVVCKCEGGGLIVGLGGLSSRLPIVAVSANAREGQVQLARESGVDDAISKPFRVADLMPIIERLVLV